MQRIDASRQHPIIAKIIRAYAGQLAIALGFTSMLLGPSAASPPDSRSVEAWQAEWTQVLQRHVDAGGMVDFSGLASDRSGLEDVVRFIAAVDPVSKPALFPTPSARLAYYIDAYNALAMYGVLDAGVPERFGWLGRFRFFYLRKFILGGRSISLYSLENDIIRPIGDPRVHFALNCMSASCPRLPRMAFTADGLDRELDAAAREFVSEERNVHVDREARTVTVSAVFEQGADRPLRYARRGLRDPGPRVFDHKSRRGTPLVQPGGSPCKKSVQRLKAEFGGHFGAR